MALANSKMSAEDGAFVRPAFSLAASLAEHSSQFELRPDDRGNRVRAEFAIEKKIIERDDSDDATVLEDGDAPTPARPHETHDVVDAGLDADRGDIAAHDRTESDLARIGGLRDDVERQVAIRHDASDAAMLDDQDRAELSVGHGSRSFVDARVGPQDECLGISVVMQAHGMRLLQMTLQDACLFKARRN